ncbi:hypothetical protein EMQU_2505 [Enterococcus mundtii QU 25]|nr:hypothetical protein EMQU_2505 [Enterococcus mundtii QU 25]
MWGSAPTDSSYVAVYSYYVVVAEWVNAMDESYYCALVWLCKVRFLVSDFWEDLFNTGQCNKYLTHNNSN